MLPYWFVFSLASLAALGTAPKRSVRGGGPRHIGLPMLWVLVIAALTMMLGFRYQVGGDWFAYVRIFDQAQFLTFEEAVMIGDPGYWLLNYFMARSGGSLVGVNLLAGLAFSTGVVIFCRSLPRPALAFAVAFPYLILVVGMGYARQGIALGFIMIGFVALGSGRFLRFVVWAIVATLFHKTAIVVIALAAASVNRNRWLWLPILGLGGLGAYTAFLADHVDRLVAGYITAEYQSQGALIRLGMNLIPAGLFLLFHRRFHVSSTDQRLWLAASLISLALFAGLMAGVPSTALDRIALYLLPLQVFVFAHLPDILGRPGGKNTVFVAGIIAYYALVLFVWLNFATNARGWLPYQVWFG